MPEPVMDSTDSSVRVVITPSQSSYFAGEPFTVNISFTNTHSPESTFTRTSNTHPHKRGAHSISSAPIARPPTSPRTATPRTPTWSSRVLQNRETLPERRRLIGKTSTRSGAHDSTNSNDLPDLLEQRRKRLLGKSLSLSISPREEEGTQDEGGIVKAVPYLQRRSSADSHYISPTSPLVSSPLSRSQGLSLALNHPHARKNSVADTQIHSPEPDISPGGSSVASVPPSPFTPSSSTSSFTLALDPISEAPPSYPITPPIVSTPVPSSYLPMNALPSTSNPPYPPKHTRRASIGLGQPPAPWTKNPPKTAFSSSFPQLNTELILYSYAQLVGTLRISSPDGSSSPGLSSVKAALSKKSARGGGSMDITNSTRPQHHRRMSSGLLSYLSPSSLSSTLSPSSSVNGSPNDEEEKLPALDTQPAMLAVDLALLPGETRSYTYTILLPEHLPPTFRGRAVRFSYELVVGTCRAGAGGPGEKANVSRVMKVPVRVYNHVAIGKSLLPYDLLWPVRGAAKGQSPSARVTQDTEKSIHLSRPALIPRVPSKSDGSLEELKVYAQRLLDSFSIPHRPEEGNKPAWLRLPEKASVGSDDEDAGHVPIREWRRETHRERQDEGGLTGCREAVEILTRNPRKASYDVNKDGVQVAVLTFTKSAYRLGETVLGVVEINARRGRSRVLQLSAMLESHESLPSSLCPPTPSNLRLLRRVHAEHHSSFTLSTLRTTFALDIPSDASPAFQLHLGENRPGKGGLEWRVRLCLLVAVAAEDSKVGTEGVRVRGLARDGERGEWGTSWCATRTVAPMENPRVPSHLSPSASGLKSAGSWTAFFLGTTEENNYHDGDTLSSHDSDEDEEDEGGQGIFDGIKPDKAGGVGMGVNFGGGEEGWKEIKVETVECEVPVKVWPGNTAFRAQDVVFDL